MTKKECDEFHNKPSVNPKTGRKIKRNGKLYKEIVDDCIDQERSRSKSRSRSKTPQKKSREITENICEQFREDPYTHPVTLEPLVESSPDQIKLMETCVLNNKEKDPHSPVDTFFCEHWKERPTQHPVTNEHIPINSPLFKELHKHCNNIDFAITIPDEKNASKDKVTYKQCVGFYIKPGFDPVSGAPININSKRYAQIQRACANHRVFFDVEENFDKHYNEITRKNPFVELSEPLVILSTSSAINLESDVPAHYKSMWKALSFLLFGTDDRYFQLYNECYLFLNDKWLAISAFSGGRDLQSLKSSLDMFMRVMLLSLCELYKLNVGIFMGTKKYNTGEAINTRVQNYFTATLYEKTLYIYKYGRTNSYIKSDDVFYPLGTIDQLRQEDDEPLPDLLSIPPAPEDIIDPEILKLASRDSPLPDLLPIPPAPEDIIDPEILTSTIPEPPITQKTLQAEAASAYSPNPPKSSSTNKLVELKDIEKLVGKIQSIQNKDRVSTQKDNERALLKSIGLI